VSEKNFLDVEDLVVYQRLCRLHIDVSEVSHKWPPEERFELGAQARRSSNSAPAQLAEKNDDRHVRNKVEGVNRSRGEAAESVHHLYVARLKGYVTDAQYCALRARYKECIRMLNGLEKVLERKLPAAEQRWEMRESSTLYEVQEDTHETGWPPPTDTRHLTPPARSPHD